jgi:hypothetical protein
MLSPEIQSDIRLAIDRWKCWSQIAEMAQARHGWGISGVWGVEYRTDPWSDCADVRYIPNGHVIVRGHWGECNFDHVIHEAEYLTVLERVLLDRGLKRHAKRIARLCESILSS